MIEKNPGEPIPDELRAYLVKFLRDPTKIKQQRGPKKDKGLALMREAAEESLYSRALEAFQKRDKQLKKRAKRRKERLPRTRLAPHERALQYMARKLDVSPETFRNRLSRKGLLPNSRQSRDPVKPARLIWVPIK
jgi:hypothetical protein